METVSLPNISLVPHTCAYMYRQPISKLHLCTPPQEQQCAHWPPEEDRHGQRSQAGTIWAGIPGSSYPEKGLEGAFTGFKWAHSLGPAGFSLPCGKWCPSGRPRMGSQSVRPRAGTQVPKSKSWPEYVKLSLFKTGWLSHQIYSPVFILPPGKVPSSTSERGSLPHHQSSIQF